MSEGASSGHDDHAGHDHLSHVTPVRLLVLVWGALMVLTVVTVAVTRINLGADGNLIVAMIIATIKAALVITYFMHLRWDKPFHTLIFLGSLLFVALFITLTLADKREYQPDVDALEIRQSAP
jgi:cytochrome c oxidase subunit IV